MSRLLSFTVHCSAWKMKCWLHLYQTLFFYHMQMFSTSSNLPLPLQSQKTQQSLSLRLSNVYGKLWDASDNVPLRRDFGKMCFHNIASLWSPQESRSTQGFLLIKGRQWYVNHVYIMLLCFGSSLDSLRLQNPSS